MGPTQYRVACQSTLASKITYFYVYYWTRLEFEQALAYWNRISLAKYWSADA